jgi:hypothetical protein
VRDQVSHPYKTGKIIVLCNLNFVFLDSRRRRHLYLIKVQLCTLTLFPNLLKEKQWKTSIRVCNDITPHAHHKLTSQRQLNLIWTEITVNCNVNCQHS